MQEWLMTITLGIIGVFLIAATYAALYQSKKSQKHISGFPFFGGFILAVAFLFSPIKWLAFLGFIDYGLWLLCCSPRKIRKTQKCGITRN